MMGARRDEAPLRLARAAGTARMAGKAGAAGLGDPAARPRRGPASGRIRP
jgi:hypothetical protein